MKKNQWIQINYWKWSKENISFLAHSNLFWFMKDTKGEKWAFGQLPCGRNSMWLQRLWVHVIKTMHFRGVSNPGARGDVTRPACVALRRLKAERRRSCSADSGVSSPQRYRQLPLRSSVPRTFGPSRWTTQRSLTCWNRRISELFVCWRRLR